MTKKIKSIVVFCGSSPGNDPEYEQQAALLGKIFAEKEITLVYGGGKNGLMGTVSDAVLKNGGEVVGVIPGFLKDLELAHSGVTKMYFVETMHERKAKMYEMADAVIALPGGYGTLDELAEILAWKKLKLHDKPVMLLNINGFFDHLLDFADVMVSSGFMEETNLISAKDVDELVLRIMTLS